MNKKFTKTVAATLAAMSIANVAVFADDAPAVEEAPSKITVDIEAIKAEGKILNTFGDINLDGEVTNADLLLCAKAVIGAEKLEGYNYIIADINKDGLITNSDIVILSKVLVGFEYEQDYNAIKDLNKENGHFDALFPDPDAHGTDYKPGVISVRFYYAVSSNLMNDAVSQEQFNELIPNVDIAYVNPLGPVSGYGTIYLKENTKEAVKDALKKLEYCPYIEHANAIYI